MVQVCILLKGHSGSCQNKVDHVLCCNVVCLDIDMDK
jgi:hypothetical protein